MTMDITRVSTILPPAATGPASFSGQNQIEDDKKRSNLAQTHPEEIGALSKELNNYMDHLQVSIGFVLHEDLDKQVVMEIKDRKTGELIRQIPSEELLKIREKMIESTGLILDQRL